MDSQILYIVTAALFGIVAGAGIMYFLSNKGADSAKSVAQVEEKLTKYQEDVVTHFEQTADLVDELTQSYKRVFDHLGQSARELLTEEQVQAQIEKRKDRKVTLGFMPDEPVADNEAGKVVEEAVEEVKHEEVNQDSTKEIKDERPETKDPLEEDVEELIEEIEAELEKQTKED